MSIFLRNTPNSGNTREKNASCPFYPSLPMQHLPQSHSPFLVSNMGCTLPDLLECTYVDICIQVCNSSVPPSSQPGISKPNSADVGSLLKPFLGSKTELSQAHEVVCDLAMLPSDLFSPVAGALAEFLPWGCAQLVSDLTAFVPDTPSRTVSLQVLGAWPHCF